MWQLVLAISLLKSANHLRNSCPGLYTFPLFMYGVGTQGSPRKQRGSLLLPITRSGHLSLLSMLHATKAVTCSFAFLLPLSLSVEKASVPSGIRHDSRYWFRLHYKYCMENTSLRARVTQWMTITQLHLHRHPFFPMSIFALDPMANLPSTKPPFCAPKVWLV